MSLIKLHLNVFKFYLSIFDLSYNDSGLLSFSDTVGSTLLDYSNDG